jgi:hypothetical protein
LNGEAGEDVKNSTAAPGSYAAYAADLPGPDEREIRPVDPVVLKHALDRLKAAAKGNGIDPDTIEMTDFKGETFHFLARSLFTVIHGLSEKHLPGKEAAEICASASDLKIKIQQTIEKTTTNKEIVGYVIDVLEKRADKGFFINNLVLKLDRLAKKLAFYNHCSACTAGKIICMTCQGAGAANCQRCQAHRTIKCPMCRGTGAGRQKDGSMGTCRKCNGQKEAPCNFCRATGKVKCQSCQGSGRTPCQKCAATGIISEIAYVTFEGKTYFTYEHEMVDGTPMPLEIFPLIDQLGPDMAAKEHADIVILKEKEQSYAQDEYQTTEKVKTKDELVVPYDVLLPWGDIQFKIAANDKQEERILDARLFGIHPRLLNLPPFLEKPLGPGLDRLTQAANNLGNVHGNVVEAIRFRIIGDALIAGATLPQKKAILAMRRRWPLGLRPQITDKMTILAAQAYQNLSKKPRIMGLIGGLVLGAVVYAAYLIGPLRGLLVAQQIHPVGMIALDAILVALVGYGAMVLAQFSAKRSMWGLFEKILPIEKARKITPRAGRVGPASFAGAAVIFIVIIGVMMTMGLPLPEWASGLVPVAATALPVTP